jgi:hypothetical protein
MSGPIRLEREMPLAGQAGCATSIGVVLSVIGVVVIVVMTSGEPSAGQQRWPLYVPGGILISIGALLVLLGIKMFLMTRLPETVVEVDKKPVHFGETFQLTVRQPGPIRLQSLRANLVCEQITAREVRRAGETRTDRDRRLVHQTNVLDLRDATLGYGEELVRHVTVSVPSAVPLADIEGKKHAVWRIEVWGKVRGWSDFGHFFVIEVVKRDGAT